MRVGRFIRIINYYQSFFFSHLSLSLSLSLSLFVVVVVEGEVPTWRWILFCFHRVFIIPSLEDNISVRIPP